MISIRKPLVAAVAGASMIASFAATEQAAAFPAAPATIATAQQSSNVAPVYWPATVAGAGGVPAPWSAASLVAR